MGCPQVEHDSDPGSNVGSLPSMPFVGVRFGGDTGL